MDVQETIRQQVTSHPVVLYMKGTPQFPMCGFSGNAVQILQALGVKDVFTVDVLSDPGIRHSTTLRQRRIRRRFRHHDRDVPERRTADITEKLDQNI